MTAILIKTYQKLGDWIPGFRKISRKWMYQSMGRLIKQDEWTFMNYGYADLGDSKNPVILDQKDEENRLSYQLYNQLAAEVELEDKQVLEVGSGRGGGASMIRKYHKPEKLTGLDFSGVAVKLCNSKLGTNGLTFVEGDAENMPFNAESFDVVINVESSHLKDVPKLFLKQFREFAGVKNSVVYNQFKNGELIYTSLIMRKAL